MSPTSPSSALLSHFLVGRVPLLKLTKPKKQMKRKRVPTYSNLSNLEDLVPHSLPLAALRQDVEPGYQSVSEDLGGLRLFLFAALFGAGLPAVQGRADSFNCFQWPGIGKKYEARDLPAS